jgi:hypothetical protein
MRSALSKSEAIRIEHAGDLLLYNTLTGILRKIIEGEMDELLQEERFHFLSNPDKAFIQAFDAEITRLGYNFGGKIGSGYCWGKYMIIYTKTGVKSKAVFARIYIRDNGLVLRLFLNGIDKHRAFIEKAPAYIKEVFIGPHGDCHRCHNDKNGVCKFRKSYTLDDRLIEKCNGITFEFQAPSIEKMGDYLALFSEFYSGKKVVNT